jgi:hypothetical protein
MLRFKKWLQFENLAGPGGGPQFDPENQESLAKNMSSKGAGAFPTTGDRPLVRTKSPTEDYDNPKFNCRKYMSDKSTNKIAKKKHA